MEWERGGMGIGPRDGGGMDGGRGMEWNGIWNGGRYTGGGHV